MTPKLLQCIRKKSKLYRLYLKGRITRVEYTYYRNKLTSLLRRVKWHHYAVRLFNAANNSFNLWPCLNNIVKRDRNQLLREIRLGDVVLLGEDLANYANNFFVTAVSSITSNLLPPPVYNFLTAPVGPSCFFYPTMPTEVVSIVNSLKNKGNNLLDIHPTIVKENVNIFGCHLPQLYNFSLSESVFPDKMKIGRIAPAHKSGPSDIMDKYRPITVLGLPLFSKVFEKLTLVRMQFYSWDIISFQPANLVSRGSATLLMQ